MLRGLVILALIIFLLLNISASCNESQININTANLAQLDRIINIGNSTATKIINYRQNNSFNSVDELLNINGIGQIKLAEIKAEGLACVSEETITETESNEVDIEDETMEQTPNNSTTQNIASNATSKSNFDAGEYASKPTTKAITLERIDLNSKDIKSDNNKEALRKNLALGGIVTFCLIFGGLFFLKLIRRKSENEFG